MTSRRHSTHIAASATAAQGTVAPRSRRRVSLAAVVVAATLALGSALAPSALAGPPIHQPLAALDIDGASTPAGELNHPCGVATDSQGDVYVASAGTNAIDVFGPDHEFLTAIADSEEPCAIAVTGEGGVYVSERKTGDVVEYKPNFYPFAGTPSYGPPSTIDGSGKANGISLDPFEERLYVAEGDRIATYDSEGHLGIDETQHVGVFNATAGGYKLSFEGQDTSVLPYSATVEEVQSALEGLSTIGAGNVTVEGAPASDGGHYEVSFVGALAHKSVEAMHCDSSSLKGENATCFDQLSTEGFSGIIAEGELSEATGIAAYTYGGGRRYLFVAERSSEAVKVLSSAGDVRRFSPAGAITGAQTPNGSFGLGKDPYLAVDPGDAPAPEYKCAPVGEEACTSGHLLVYDAGHGVVDEFEAAGRYMDQFGAGSISDAEPTAMAIDRSGTAGDGTIFATSGTGTGGRVLAFAPLPSPGRASLEGLGHKLPDAEGIAVDSHGDVYVAAQKKITIFSSTGAELTTIEDAESPRHLAVDSEGNLYALDVGEGFGGEVSIAVYHPASYPVTPGMEYGAPHVLLSKVESAYSLAVDPANGHLFAGFQDRIDEWDSVAHGSTLLSDEFGTGVLGSGQFFGLAVDGATGDVYVANGGSTSITELNAQGTEVLNTISGAGSPDGHFVLTENYRRLAIDQSSGDLLVFDQHREAVEEFDASGAFVARFGSFQSVYRWGDIAADDSGGSTQGDVYVAFDEPAPGSPDVWAFGPLEYGEPPTALTGAASEVSGGNALLSGSVNPNGFGVEECRFEFLTQEAYAANGDTFAGATPVPCVQSPAEIGGGTSAVPVHARLVGLQSGLDYRFRLVAKNKYGPSTTGYDEGAGRSAGRFGPPVLSAVSASALQDEAGVHATLDPFGSRTSYRVEYGTDASYGSEAAGGTMQAGEGSTRIEVPLFGLSAGTEYHYRVVASNEAGTVYGIDQTFATGSSSQQSCPNAAYRTGSSASLPDCRAYELVTPADFGFYFPVADWGMDGVSGGPVIGFDNWLVSPSGTSAGDRLSYFLEGAIPGMPSNGAFDGWTAVRGADGWRSSLFSPSEQETAEHTEALQGVVEHPRIAGVAPEQEYSLWTWEGRDSTLRGPAGVRPLGVGSLGVDPDARPKAITAQGAQIVFESSAHLEPQAPAAGTEAVYERSLAGDTQVISLLPGDATPAAGEDALLLGLSEDGSAAVFAIDGAIYVRRDGTTSRVTAAPSRFAGVSRDGSRVFYMQCGGCSPQATISAPAGDLFAYDVKGGDTVEIAPNSQFVNVPADGTEVYFASTERLDDAAQGVPGEDNLYVWDGVQTRFVAVLSAEDMGPASGDTPTKGGVANWVSAVETAVTGANETGRGTNYTRSTADGEVLVFQSHANLTGQDPDGYWQIYRYDAANNGLTCVSCDPHGAAADGKAVFETYDSDSVNVLTGSTLVANLTEDGRTVFFESDEALVANDRNRLPDVYEWNAPGAGGCQRAGGCVALLSGGAPGYFSNLYSVTPDGHDVFIETFQALVAGDPKETASIYDARVDGGFPVEAQSACVESGCQGPPPAAPGAQVAASAVFHGSGNVPQAQGEKGRPSKLTAHKKRSRKKKKRRHARRSARRAHHRKANSNGRGRR